MDEQIVGFDSREMWLQVHDTTWPQEHRQTFFLRDNLIKPLSVDMNVWQTALQRGEVRWNTWWMRNAEQSSAPLEDALDGFERRMSGTSPSLITVRNALNVSPHRDKPQWIVCFTILNAADVINYPYGQFVTEYTRVDPAWELLGYDVAEEFCGISSLSDMGFSNDERPFARHEFALHLNEYHLFSTLDAAQKFASWSDDRDPGHGPFFVYGIYLIEQVNFSTG